jgi:hypothetical protein
MIDYATSDPELQFSISSGNCPGQFSLSCISLKAVLTYALSFPRLWQLPEYRSETASANRVKPQIERVPKRS